jgi:predicted secreted protein
MRDKVQRGVGVVLMVNDIPVAGQQNASLTRSMVPIEITNKIDGSWKESISGSKTWKVSCGGMYVKNAESYKALENAFMNNEELTIKIMMDNHSYVGQALITNFPLNAVFNSQFKYTL